VQVIAWRTVSKVTYNVLSRTLNLADLPTQCRRVGRMAHGGLYVCLRYVLMYYHAFATATAESSSDGRGNHVWQQAGRHQTFRRKHADENAE